MKNENLHKWLNDELPHDELRNNSKELEELKKISHYVSYIETPTTDVDLAFKAFTARKKQKKNKIVFFKTYYKIAAAILLLLAPAYYLYHLNSTTNVNTQIAETSTFNLPDKSVVILNSNSKINYTKATWKKNRTLNLQGEAYFKVQKGKKFTVNTKLGNVQVLGTQFNVKQRKNIFEVVCYEGAVKVYFNEIEKILHPGNILQIINGKLTKGKNTQQKTPTWIRKESSFTNAPLINVIAELQRYYPINVNLDSVNKQQLFTGTFTHNDLDVALKTITIPLNIKYNKSNQQITLLRND